MRKLVVVVIVLSLSVIALAQNGTPSSKATADINTAVGCTLKADGTLMMAQTCKDIFGKAASRVGANNFAEVMRATIKVSNSQSLFVSPSLVTGLYTQTLTKTKTGDTSTASGMGTVVVRAVLVTPGTEDVVAVGAPVNNCKAGILGCSKMGGDFGVVFDQRKQTLTQSISECVVNVTDADGTALTGSCTFDLTTDLILQTTSAHTFNFIFPQVGVGTYDVVIQAGVRASADATTGSGAIGAAAYGLGSLTVESVRLVHDFSF